MDQRTFPNTSLEGPENYDSIPGSSQVTRHTEDTGDRNDSVMEKEKELWTKFDQLPPLPGLLGNIIAVSLTEENGSNSQSIRRLYSEQVNFAYEVSRYLLDNGVEKIMLTSNFDLDKKVQSFDFKKFPPDINANRIQVKDLNTEVDVAVIIVQSHKYSILYNFVQDALTRSRSGIIIISSQNMLGCSTKDNHWNTFVKHLESWQLIKPYLEICCTRHGFIQRITDGIQLRSQSPLGGCDGFCGTMECGHLCPYACHPSGHTSGAYRCEQPCNRVCRFGHRCLNKCWEDCGKCYRVITVNFRCEHRSFSKKQMFCHEEKRSRCVEITEKQLPCGHSILTPCYDSNTNRPCMEVFHEQLACGHTVTFKCSERSRTSKGRCEVEVTKTLKCGHTVTSKCFESTAVETELSCTALCNTTLKCKHVCKHPCHIEDPTHEGKFKCQERCTRYCDRNVHKCSTGHPCSDPCPPCQQRYDFKLVCMHNVEIICSDPDPNENSYVCKMSCQKKHQFCMHLCNKTCGEDCGVCQELVLKAIPSCKQRPPHQTQVKCQDLPPTICDVMIPAKTPSLCGHVVEVPCAEADSISPDELVLRCQSTCLNPNFDKEGECGHVCRGNCRDCYQGRLHIRCKEPCKQDLICGHSCSSPCNSVCPPCRSPCYVACGHKKCSLKCGVPCVWDCKEPCSYACKHSRCTRKCSEICNKDICSEPCDKMLKCGHACVGYCGEPCPQFCRICNPDELAQGSFLVKNENSRFISLEDCGHCIEVESFEGWLKANLNSAEITPLRCPLCRTLIHWIHRYSSVFHEKRKMVNVVRSKIFGDPQEIENILQEIQQTLTRECVKYQKPPPTSFLQRIKDTVNKQQRTPYQEFMWLGMARFLQWICEEWVAMNETLSTSLLDIPVSFKDRFSNYWASYLEMSHYYREWPLHPNEMRALERERARLDDILRLYTRLSPGIFPRASKLLTNAEAQKMFLAADLIVTQPVAYTIQSQQSFYTKLQDLDNVINSTLKISEPERLQIISAFGQRAGRWFKCKNGHVYVITECGGAEELGTCNECGAVIGGESHMLAAENYLASEMDGAIEPLYPTVLDRPGE